jgi:hypothetical protein
MTGRVPNQTNGKFKSGIGFNGSSTLLVAAIELPQGWSNREKGSRGFPHRERVFGGRIFRLRKNISE